MIVCTSCSQTHSTLHQPCPQCGYQIAEIEGFLALAPDLAYGGGGFLAESFERLYRNEANHFWFKNRNNLLLMLLRNHAATMDSFFEIGCGTGFVLQAVAQQWPKARLMGGELFVNGLRFAAQRIPNATFIQIDATRMPFAEEFAVIGLFDVLEHIGPDTQVLAEVYRALKPGGHAVISVPQHMWMWSEVDTFSHHQRRYAIGEMEQKAQAAGFRIVRSTSFMSMLLPMMYVSRLLQQKTMKKSDGLGEFEISPALNHLFGIVCRFEVWCVKMGFNWPIGGSRVVVIEKPTNPTA